MSLGRLKLKAKSFGDRSQDIWKYIERASCWLLRLKLSTSKLFQLVRDECHDVNKLLILCTSRCFFFFFSFSFFCLPRSFLQLNNLRESWKRCCHSIFSSQVIINNYSPKWRWIVVGICWAAKRWDKYALPSPTLRWIIIPHKLNN